MAQRRIPCLLMRGGTSKAACFLADSLPDDPARRDAVLLAVMGSPDSRQIDGIGGGDPLTSKVAIVRPSARPDADVDYLFAQVNVDRATVDYGQNCGNVLAAIGPFAIERGLVAASAPLTSVRIYMENTGQLAIADVPCSADGVEYAGETRIDGVPGSGSRIVLNFSDVAGSGCGALLPTGSATDRFDGVEVTCIDNGMPVVLVRAGDLGRSGYESREALDNDDELKRRLESIRLQAGPRMNLGDVASRTVPKMTLIAAPRSGGTLSSRTFIPHRCHASIGVFGAVSVASACLIPGSVAEGLAQRPADSTYSIEHPGGEFSVVLAQDADGQPAGCGLIRTARLLFAGEVAIPAAVWPQKEEA
ncbi:4-oxalomesaconate tautomerase [Pluralibacter gergoviae]|uniref:4-oxalomesaconate tautomerase n=1 Tax=Pluralibacter gergoviae TaxID=61647 RepID=A0A0F0VMF8_PLUGE|nr:4-oxalomesaconate tautomerase [Pluralibacter gergoviae]EKT9642265.1 4-oxalomesaconate tautomerase [Pluralibacter gergoviae]EKV0916592.1 4-oxalomesaconate tautomerase [Pluralibacter gergoviae]EKV0930780.1 4-oxalomesaconate tautomerase [Pluralibacter gergoviae]EKV3544351.1 4-oxalomesaconate tautomerase [Pluralibacter gergoviae]EKV6249025.1 4-oxalomesaconate tautomerase [Pluralibacter gergoviae]